MTLLNTVTMQKVACATMMVAIPNRTSRMVRKKLLRAIPVTMPGSAIGRMTSRLTASRPKNSKRWRASEIIVPRINEIAVAASAICTLVVMPSSAPAFWNALPHHSSVKPGGGQVRLVLVLNELTNTTNSGR